MTTATDAGLELASMEDTCWLCAGLKEYRREVDLEGPPHTCSVCNGTGRVPRFPGVRVYAGHKNCAHADIDDKSSMDCQGRGWTVSDRLEDVLDAIHSEGFQVKTAVVRERKLFILYQDAPHAWGNAGEGDTWIEAAWDALLRTVKVTA